MKVKQEIEDIISLLVGPIDPLKDLLKPFHDLYSLVFDTIKAVKEAYQTLRDGWVNGDILCCIYFTEAQLTMHVSFLNVIKNIIYFGKAI